MDIIDYGRRMDFADRFINARTTKYLLRANRCQQADETINLFVKTDKEYSLSLFELQCMWYVGTSARTHSRPLPMMRGLKTPAATHPPTKLGEGRLHDGHLDRP